MKAVIINCFDTYMERVNLVSDYFKEKSYDVTIIESNYSHSKKEYIDNLNVDDNIIKVKSYKKNISFNRLYSHYNFSKLALKRVNEIHPDVLYVILPANSLAKFSADFKKTNPDTKLIFDIMDLWPETFPLKSFKNLFPFRYWANFRDRNLKYADFVITECNLFLTKIRPYIKNEKTLTNYLAKNSINLKNSLKPINNEINLAYLGSINNIIDIDVITRIIVSLIEFYPVKLHIVGDGENRERLIESAREANAEVIFHGKVYDPQEKQNIFDQCHFGLNIMKESVFVGLTMKSIDYAQFGLPLINNIPADTEKIVADEYAGVNITNGIYPDEIIEYFHYINQSSAAKKNIKDNVFEKYFSVKVFNNKLDEVFSKINL